MTNDQLAQLLYRLERKMTEQLDNLKRALAAQSDVTTQVVAKVADLKTNAADPAIFDQIRATVEANTQALVGLLN